jgi:hypothetical protein
MQSEITRRDFLKCSGLALAAISAHACAPRLMKTGVPEEGQNFYLAKKDDILDTVDPYFKELRKELLAARDESRAGTLIEEARQKYDGILHILPDIGGYSNVLIQTFYTSAATLAFYQVMKADGRLVEESGRLIYRAMRSIITAPEVMGGVDTRAANSTAAREHYRKTSAWSQKKQYPADWLYEYVEGDGTHFDYGVNYRQCAICKFFQAQAAGELTPYLCLGDYPTSQNYDMGLVRTQTLARGGAYCDFRYKPGRETKIEWMPDFILKP